MAAIRYSRRALEDLNEIAMYSIEHWGEPQARRYVDALESACRLLSVRPRIGRKLQPFANEWFRWEHESHIILYRVIADGIVVQRIVHQRRALEKLLR